MTALYVLTWLAIGVLIMRILIDCCDPQEVRRMDEDDYILIIIGTVLWPIASLFILGYAIQFFFKKVNGVGVKKTFESLYGIKR